MLVTGEIREDSRSKFGYEIGITNVEVVSESHDYPITPKEETRNRFLDGSSSFMATFFQDNMRSCKSEMKSFVQRMNSLIPTSFVKIDPPILTGSAPEAQRIYSETNYFDQKAYLSRSG